MMDHQKRERLRELVLELTSTGHVTLDDAKLGVCVCVCMPSMLSFKVFPPIIFGSDSARSVRSCSCGLSSDGLGWGRLRVNDIPSSAAGACSQPAF